MSTVEKIYAEVVGLRPEKQAEVLDFVEFLKNRDTQKDDREFKSYSLGSAMRGMEDEPDLYDESDIKELLP